jgi:hypothetical protein
VAEIGSARRPLSFLYLQSAGVWANCSRFDVRARFRGVSPSRCSRAPRNRWLTGLWRLTHRPSDRSGSGQALRGFVRLFVGILVSPTLRGFRWP